MSPHSELSRFTNTLQLMTERMPSRITLRQCLFFATVAEHDLAGRSITVRRVRELLGDAIGKSIEKSYMTFLPPSKKDPDSLGWIVQVQDEDDRRSYHLKLTADGRRFLSSVIDAQSR